MLRLWLHRFCPSLCLPAKCRTVADPFALRLHEHRRNPTTPSLFTYFTSLSTCACCSFPGHNKTSAPFTSLCLLTYFLPLNYLCVCVFPPFLRPQNNPGAPPPVSAPAPTCQPWPGLFTYFVALSTCVCFHSVSFLWVQQNKRSSLEHDSSL